MKKTIVIAPVLVMFLMTVIGIKVTHAHFGMIIPSASVISANGSRSVNLVLSFSHPFEQQGMQLNRPKSFGVTTLSGTKSLLDQLKPVKKLGFQAWQTDYPLRRPGTRIFHMEPHPYWEETENCYIIHYTKTVVAAYGDDEGWDTEVGLKTEIVPVSKPLALYTHNLFQGIVKLNGKPVPDSIVEVEYFNPERDAKAPNELMITQTIRADRNGLFSYAVPKSGWLGFAALNPAGYQITRQGEKKDVELGAVIWVQFLDWNQH